MEDRAALRPAGYSTTRAGASLSRAMSSPDGVITASGLPASKLLNSTAVRVGGATACSEPRKDAIVGYRGFIPGVTSETIYGASKCHANVIAHTMRPHAGENLYRRHGEEYEWKCAPDAPIGRRSETSCTAWTEKLHACPPPLNGGTQPRHFGSAMQGFCGHKSMRLERPSIARGQLGDTLGHGGRLLLDHTMSRDRETQPFEMHRIANPGYSGHIRGRSVA